MADEEPVNPQIELEEACKPQCVKALLEYQVRGQRLIIINLMTLCHGFFGMAPWFLQRLFTDAIVAGRFSST